MTTFLERALPLIERGIPVIPLLPKKKYPDLPGWQNKATTDLEQIKKWNEERPDSNIGCVAFPDGFFFVEVDRPGVIERLEAETGQRIPNTMRVRSRIGRGHIYLRQTDLSRRMGNIAQGFVKGGDFSVRVDREFVCGPKSIHPATDQPYEIIEDSPIAEAPDWLIHWLEAQKIEKKKVQVSLTDNSPIIENRNVTLTSIAGRYRALGSPAEEINNILTRINNERCTPSLPQSEIDTIAASVGKYPAGSPDPDVLFAGAPPVAEIRQSIQVVPAPQVTIVEDDEPTQVKAMPYPNFPLWALQGTSVYEGLVKPYCDINSRYEQYMALPAIALFLNYIGLRVKVDKHHFVPSLFMVLIGRKGRTIKSSSVKSAIDYFEFAGMAGQAKSSTTNGDGRTLVWTVGSPEGLGIDMTKKNCKNALIFYDELSQLVSKAGIESSTMNSALLTLYESDKYQNVTTNRKNAFSLEPGTYCASLIACTTDKNFRQNWAKMCGQSSGLNDRFFFLFQPEKFKDPLPPIDVLTQEASLRTRKLVDKAIDKGVYEIEDCDRPALNSIFQNYSNRTAIRALKFALYFAIDLDRETIDSGCLERATALIDYEKSVKKYLRIGEAEAETREASIQQEVLFRLQQGNGSVLERDVYRAVGQKYGRSIWSQALRSLRESGDIKITGQGTRSSPKVLTLMRDLDYEDED